MLKLDTSCSSAKILKSAYLDIFEEIRHRQKGVVIASSQRCGTHLLGAYLRAVGIGSPGEHFLEYLNKRADNSINSTRLADVLTQVPSIGSGGIDDAFSVVLMDYTQTIGDDVEALGLSRSLLATSMKHLSWIWLRRDWVDVAISHYFAISTGFWESNAGHHSAPPFNAGKLHRWWQHIRDVDAFWQSYFKQHEIISMELDYAQLVRDPSTLAPLITRAGGDPHRLAAAVPPERMPLAQTKQEYATRFRDLLTEERSAQLISTRLPARRIHGTN